MTTMFCFPTFLSRRLRWKCLTTRHKDTKIDVTADDDEEDAFPPPVPRTYKVTRKVKAVKKSEWEKETVCTICHDTHKKKDCWMTDCGHEFGAECLSESIQSMTHLCCPLCMKRTTKVTAYRQWGKPCRAGNPVDAFSTDEEEEKEEEEDDEDVIELVEIFSVRLI